MTIAASFTPKPAILSFAITHELLTMRLFLDSLANNNFRMKYLFILILLPLIKVKSVKFSLFISLTESTSSLFYRLECKSLI